ncbi:hypothetical protein ACFQ0D_37115, partial [Micromonospora zhanjiangensis]
QTGPPSAAVNGRHDSTGVTRVTPLIPAQGYLILNPDGGRFLQLVGLTDAVAVGQAVELTFDFGGQQLTVNAPVAVPLTPAPTSSPVVSEGHEG